MPDATNERSPPLSWGFLLDHVGEGELSDEVHAIAASHPPSIRVLPFQNQSKMQLFIDWGNAFVLPYSHNETWGLAVNEAIACGRPALVTTRVDARQMLSGRISMEISSELGLARLWGQLRNCWHVTGVLNAPKFAKMPSVSRLSQRRVPDNRPTEATAKYMNSYLIWVLAIPYLLWASWNSPAFESGATVPLFCDRGFISRNLSGLSLAATRGSLFTGGGTVLYFSSRLLYAPNHRATLRNRLIFI